MTFKIYTYKQALDKIKPNLKVLIKKRKLREFWTLYKDKYNLSYHTLQQIASDTNTKEFPDTLFSLMNIFGYHTERTKAFKIFDKDDENKEYKVK
jgi:hypothetical protein